MTQGAKQRVILDKKQTVYMCRIERQSLEQAVSVCVLKCGVKGVGSVSQHACASASLRLPLSIPPFVFPPPPNFFLFISSM